MSEILQTCPLNMDLKGRHPLFLEFPKPFRVSPSKLYNMCLVGGSAKSLLWVQPKGALRVAPNPAGRISDYDIAKAIASNKEFRNHFPCTPDGIQSAIRFVRGSFTGKIVVLRGHDVVVSWYPERFLYDTEVPWLKDGQAVVVPELRSEVGFRFTSPAGDFIVVHNPLKSIAVVGSFAE